jgi:hypothetical protein
MMGLDLGALGVSNALVLKIIQGSMSQNLTWYQRNDMLDLVCSCVMPMGLAIWTLTQAHAAINLGDLRWCGGHDALPMAALQHQQKAQPQLTYPTGLGLLPNFLEPTDSLTQYSLPTGAGRVPVVATGISANCEPGRMHGESLACLVGVSDLRQTMSPIPRFCASSRGPRPMLFDVQHDQQS